MGRFDYVAIDLDHPLATRTMDVRSMAFGDASFDLVLCFHVLALLPDDSDAVRELARVLAPGGTLVLSEAPGCAHWAAALEAQGLDVDVLRTDGVCTPEEIERYGLVADECICLCRRP
jgi:ubiquinone/menaquinone biosynthesis C-methylase UbiE